MIAEEQNQVRKLGLAFLCSHRVGAPDKQSAILAKRFGSDAVFQIRKSILQPLFRMVDDEAGFRMLQKPPFAEDLRQEGRKTIHWEGKDGHSVLSRTIMQP